MKTKTMEVMIVKRELRAHQVLEDELIQLAEGGYFHSSRKEMLAASFATFTSFLIALLTCRDLNPYVYGTFLALVIWSGVTSVCLFCLVRSDNRQIKEYVKSLREAPEA